MGREEEAPVDRYKEASLLKEKVLKGLSSEMDGGIKVISTESSL